MDLFPLNVKLTRLINMSMDTKPDAAVALEEIWYKTVHQGTCYCFIRLKTGI